MISFDDARQKILAVCTDMAAERILIADGRDRVLARDVFATENLPPFDNSAMDGFAIATGSNAVVAGSEFAVHGSQVAGDDDAHCAEGAFEIMTGASLPIGLDAVVPVEQVSVLARDARNQPSRIRIDADVMPGQHVRYCGQDVAVGDRVLRAGTRITAVARMLLTAQGVVEIKVRVKPAVALLSTGRELVDDARKTLLPGQIRNSNGPFLQARLLEAGAHVVHQETVPDDASAFIAALQRSLAAGARMVLSTGAVSMGRHDFVPDALRSLGAEIVFHKVAIRPGKPLLFARLSNGALYFGLPGNPVSSAVGLRFFVEPALRIMLGLPAERAMPLPLAHAVSKKSGLRWLQKAQVRHAGGGQLQVRLLAGQESFRIQPMLAANAWAILPEMAEQFSAGTLIDVMGLDGRGVILNTTETDDEN